MQGAAAAALVAVAVLGASCGDDAPALEDSFCPLYVEIVEVKTSAAGASDPAAVKAAYGRLVPLTRDLEDEAPDDVRNEVTELVEVAEAVSASGDAASWENYWQGGTNVIDHYVKTNCGIEIDG